MLVRCPGTAESAREVAAAAAHRFMKELSARSPEDL